jgi:lia operon protein LiaF
LPWRVKCQGIPAFGLDLAIQAEQRVKTRADRRKKMRNQGQLILGIVVIVIGLAFLIGNLFDVNVWTYCWPVGLILLGVWLLLRPRLVSSDTAVRQKLLGDIRRDGVWQVADEEIWIGIGDVRLDMTEAEIPPGETRVRVWGFVGDVRLSLPEGVGVSLSSNAFVTDVKALGHKREGILVPVRIASDDYETAERKVRLETTFFVGDVTVRKVEQSSP